MPVHERHSVGEPEQVAQKLGEALAHGWHVLSVLLLYLPAGQFVKQVVPSRKNYVLHDEQVVVRASVHN